VISGQPSPAAGNNVIVEKLQIAIPNEDVEMLIEPGRVAHGVRGLASKAVFNQLWLKPTDLNGHDQSLMRIPGDDALSRNPPP